MTEITNCPHCHKEFAPTHSNREMMFQCPHCAGYFVFDESSIHINRKRPWGVTLIGFLTILGSSLAVLGCTCVGLAIFFSTQMAGQMEELDKALSNLPFAVDTILLPVIAVITLLNVFMLVTAISLLRGGRAARIIIMITSAIGILGQGAELLYSGGMANVQIGNITALAYSIFVVIYLNKRSVGAWFKQAHKKG